MDQILEENIDKKSERSNSVTLTIASIDEDERWLEEVTKTLGFQPSATHLKGDRREPRARPYPTTMWMYDSSLKVGELKSIDSHVFSILEKIPANDSVADLFTHNDARLYLYLSDEGGPIGFHLKPQLLEKMGRLKIELHASIYSWTSQ